MTRINDYLWHLPHAASADDPPDVQALQQAFNAPLVAALEEPLARFAREHLYATLAYCAACAPEVADRLEDVDRALRWGFNWEAGPFEMIDLLGPRTVADGLEAGGQPVPDLLAAESLHHLLIRSRIAAKAVCGLPCVCTI